MVPLSSMAVGVPRNASRRPRSIASQPPDVSGGGNGRMTSVACPESAPRMAFTVKVPGARADTAAQPRARSSTGAAFESLETHASTVESARSATKLTQPPASTVSTAGRMPKEAGVGPLGALGPDSLQAKTAAAEATKTRRFIVQRAAHDPYRADP